MGIFCGDGENAPQVSRAAARCIEGLSASASLTQRVWLANVEKRLEALEELAGDAPRRRAATQNAFEIARRRG